MNMGNPLHLDKETALAWRLVGIVLSCLDPLIIVTSIILLGFFIYAVTDARGLWPDLTHVPC